MLLDRIERAPPQALAAREFQGDSITYGELLAEARALSLRLGPQRRLVLLEATSTIRWLVAYLACLLGRHPVLIAPAVDSIIEKLDGTFRPDVILRFGNDYEPGFSANAAPKELHPDLAILLSTSGSTGSAKSVRLSHDNISENAAAICEFLEISADERGVVNLPTHYSYGLSVVNSHLYAGAALLLADCSVVEPKFWQFLCRNGATSFQGVPHVYDLLSRIDLAAEAPKTLRYFTQAGGRLVPEKVKHFDALARTNGWRFHVMYGQTEATARMAYMPAEELQARPDSIGIPIPGGRFTIVDEAGQTVAPGVIGQLQYDGPNVMMGYASGPDELAMEPMSETLATGDLARVDNEGYFYICGRQSRFIKIFGNRIDLDEVEHMLCDAGIDAVTTGIDERLLVVTSQPGKESKIADLLATINGISRNNYSILLVSEFPLTTTGKIDYQYLQGFIKKEPKKPTSALTFLRSLLGGKLISHDDGVREVYRELFGDAANDPDETFKSLGGDSLTWFSTSLKLENCVNNLPRNWDTLSISRLCEMEREAGEQPSGKNSNPFSNVDTLRGLACLLVVLFHVVGFPDTGLRLQDGMLRWLVDSLDYIRMPLFVAIAGLFYAAASDPHGGFRGFLSSRFAMLILPALSVTPIYWAVRYAVYGIDDSLLAGLTAGYLHLWFLYALMVISVIAAVFDRFLRITPWGWGVLIVAAPIVSVNLPRIQLFAFSDAISLLSYFALGVFLYRVPQVLRSKTMFVAAMLTAIVAIGVQQAEMQDLIVLAGKHLWSWSCIGGVSCTVLMLVLFPRIPGLEAISPYTYTIYLWHPMANGGARVVLQSLGITNTVTLLVLGFLCGTFGPIFLHRLYRGIRDKANFDSSSIDNAPRKTLGNSAQIT